MFSKVLKYDFRAVGRLWWILAVAVAWLSVVGGFAFRFMETVSDRVDSSLLLVAMLMVSVLVFVGSLIVLCSTPLISQILIYYRYYKNFFTDEGYLTFTLPVSRNKLLLSKTVNAFIWTALTTVLMMICTAIFILFAFPAGSTDVSFSWIAETFSSMFKMLWRSIDVWGVIYLIEMLLCVLAYVAFGVSLVHYSILTGAVVAKKHKLLAGIGIYYLANVVVTSVVQTVVILGSGLMSSLTDGLDYTAEAILNVTGSTMLLAGAVGLAIGMYLLTARKLERKLNLE